MAFHKFLNAADRYVLYTHSLWYMWSFMYVFLNWSLAKTYTRYFGVRKQWAFRFEFRGGSFWLGIRSRWRWCSECSNSGACDPPCFPTYLLLVLQNSSYPRVDRKSFPLWRISLPPFHPLANMNAWGRGGCIIVLHSSLLLKFSPPLRSCDSW